MTRATTSQGVTTFAYDPLGRRIAKHSQALDGGVLRESTRTMYGWDGDTLALESSVYGGHTVDERTVHYMYERDSFVPLMQATLSQALRLAPSTDVKALMASNYGTYDIELDPLWNAEYEQKSEPFSKDEIAFYQCDHLGTPQELTDCQGKVAWSAQYRAWGKAKEAFSRAAYDAGILNPLRFQGQYFDDETELHYNRFRYYDPNSGRFLSRDPAGLFGGFNVHSYAPNPIQWVDPLGLAAIWDCKSNNWRDSTTGRYRGRPIEAVKTEPNQAYFWSGRTEGIGGEAIARQIAIANGGTTLELQLEKNGVVMPPWDPNNPRATREWKGMSKSYAHQACGVTRGIIGKELRPGNVWEAEEKGTLKDNPLVNRIDTIDPKTGATKTIFKR